MKTDLHIHTTASDGALTPKETVQWAKSKGLELIAITDHDTIDGLDEAKLECQKLGIKFIPGIEISTLAKYDIHILGYNIDYKDKNFISDLEKIKEMRIIRNIKIGDKLKALNINLDLDYSVKGLGRMEIARHMVKEGYCETINEVFEQYLGDKGKAYVESERITPMQAVMLIKKYHGFSSIAHPKKILANGDLEILIRGLKKYGLNGLELNYPSHTPQDIVALKKYLKAFRLLPTGGSDFHGEEDKDYIYDINRVTFSTLYKNKQLK